MNRIYLEVIYGTMGSGKTGELLSRIGEIEGYDEEAKGKDGKVFVIKPEVDDRDDGVIKSRDGRNRKVDLLIPKKKPNFDLFNAVRSYKNEHPNLVAVAIDEIQFLPDLSKVVWEITRYLDVQVIASGLYYNFQGKVFLTTASLLGHADLQTPKFGTCKLCQKNPSTMVARIDEYGNYITDGEIVVIGGNESYKPLCYDCFMKEVEPGVSKAKVRTKSK